MLKQHKEWEICLDDFSLDLKHATFWEFNSLPTSSTTSIIVFCALKSMHICIFTFTIAMGSWIHQVWLTIKCIAHKAEAMMNLFVI